jgi:hypothetical protein
MDLSNVPDNLKAAVTKRHQNSPLAHLDQKQVAKDVIARYMAGEQIPEISKSYGLKSSERLYQVLVEHAPDEWKKATTAKALARHNNAVERIEEAQDMLSLGRGRELARLAQWELERVCRPIYGQEQVAVQVNINLGDMASRLSELEAELGIAPQHTQVIDVQAQQDGESE